MDLKIVKENIKDTSNKLKNILLNSDNYGIVKEYSFDIDCGLLDDFNNYDIRDDIKYKKTFEDITELKGPVLYWFEIISNIENDKIRESINRYREKNNSKSIPAMKKTFDKNSRCLYVGKVKKGVWGRMIQHLGFYKVKRTQGLQLFYWAKELNLNIKIHLYEFDSGFEDLVEIFEKELARKINPILGKH